MTSRISLRASNWASAWWQTGHEVGTPTDDRRTTRAADNDSSRQSVDAEAEPPTRKKAGPTDIAAELKRIVRNGLPVDLARAGDVLPNLRSVIARSVHPSDLISRLDALNQLLARLLADAGEEPQAEAARTIFRVARGTGSLNLTQRRAAAASLLGYDPDHFRKHIEPKLIADLAETIHRDLLRYKARVKRAPESLQPTGDSPRLDEAHFTHQEELISRIWRHVYALRAELIAVGRRERAPDAELRSLEIEEHRQAAATEERNLRRLVGEYAETYGEALIRHGDSEYAAEGLVRLVEWTLDAPAP